MSYVPGIKPEWSFEIIADHVNEKGVTRQAAASELECKDIARRLDVEQINKLEASITLVREPASIIIHAHGTFKAEIVQKCVVSLEPVVTHIEESFEAWFADTEQVVSLAHVRQEKLGKVIDMEMEIPDEKDDPEPVVDGRIELGEIIIQNLALSINPYPHAEGAVYKDICEHPDTAGNKEGRYKPFANLKKWKEEQEKD